MTASTRHRLREFAHSHSLDPLTIALILSAIAQLIYYLTQIWSEDEVVRHSRAKTIRYRLNVWLACWKHLTTDRDRVYGNLVDFFANLPDSEKRELLLTRGLFLPKDMADIIGDV